MKGFTSVCILLFLIGCSALTDVAGGAIKGALGGDDGGIALDAQVGDNESETSLQSKGARGTGDVIAKDDAHVEVNTEQVDTQVRSAEKVNITNQEIAPWYLIISISCMILFWTLPAPSQMGSWVKRKLTKPKVHRKQRNR
jgi:hypothetical protein